MLELRNVTYAYPGAERPALAGLSLSVSPGERVVLRGANGSGKSTAASLLNGTLLPDAGSVLLDGVALTNENAPTFAQSVGVVRQDPLAQLVEPTVFEEVAFGPQCLGLPAEEVRERARVALAACGLTGHERRNVFELSGGQQQLCALAGVLAMDPSYLVLDEAGSHLDRTGRLALRRVIDAALEAGVGVLQISHDLRDVSGADRVVELRRTEGGSLLVPYEREAATRRGEGFSERACAQCGADIQATGASQSASEAPILSAEHICFAYDEKPVLEDVSLCVRAGELALICGPSGVGKSTFARVMAGVLEPRGGEVRIEGAPVRPGSVGFVMQRAEDQLFAASVREDVAFGPRNLGLPDAEVASRTERALETMRVPRAVWDASPFTLSGGMRRRVALAGVVALGARAYVFDEPGAGLDEEAKVMLHELVSRLLSDGAAVVVVTHDPGEWAGLACRTLALNASHATSEDVIGTAESRAAAARRAPFVPDSRASIAAVLLLTVALFAAHSALGLAVVAAAAAVLATCSRVRPRDLTTMLKPASVLAALMFVSQVLVFDGSFDLQFVGSFGVRVGSVARAAFSALRILGLVVLAGVAAKAVASTSPTTLASAVVAPLRTLGMRADAVTMAVSVTLRMMPEVTREFGRITTAQRARAGHLDEGRALERLKSYASVLVPLIVSLMQRSDDLARAMHDRCYTGSLTRLDESLKPYDMLLVAGAVVVLVIVCVV